jgi:hypothetical protein
MCYSPNKEHGISCSLSSSPGSFASIPWLLWQYVIYHLIILIVAQSPASDCPTCAWDAAVFWADWQLNTINYPSKRWCMIRNNGKLATVQQSTTSHHWRSLFYGDNFLNDVILRSVSLSASAKQLFLHKAWSVRQMNHI